MVMATYRHIRELCTLTYAALTYVPDVPGFTEADIVSSGVVTGAKVSTSLTVLQTFIHIKAATSA